MSEAIRAEVVCYSCGNHDGGVPGCFYCGGAGWYADDVRPGSLTEAKLKLADAALIHDRDFRIFFENVAEMRASADATAGFESAIAAVRNHPDYKAGS